MFFAIITLLVVAAMELVFREDMFIEFTQARLFT